MTTLATRSSSPSTVDSIHPRHAIGPHPAAAPLKLLVFGATGSTGRAVLGQALASGHTVTAFVRDPAKLAVQHPRLMVFQGDVTDADAVGRAVPGHDAVICALGAPASDTSQVRAIGTAQVIAAMQDSGVQRLICLSSLGVGDSWQGLPFYLKYIVVPLWLRRAFADHNLHEQAIQNSELDWTIVRPPFLTDGARTDGARHGFPVTQKGLKYKVSRADVAAFMLEEVTGRAYVQQAVGISY